MKYLLVFCLFVSMNGFSQEGKNKTLNEYIFEYIKSNANLEQYDTLCIESCAFAKFSIHNKKISALKMSSQTPEFLKLTLKNALHATAAKWSSSMKGDYVLPVVYVFESNCSPVNRSSGSILRILQDLSDSTQTRHFPGFGNDKPLKCVILNPLFIKSHYE